MILATPAPFVDTSPEDLSFSLVSPLLPALATRTVGPVALRVIGASHQVQVGEWVETLACLPGQTPVKPRRHMEPGYTVTIKTSTYTPDDFRRQAATIREHLEAHETSLLVTFAGDPDALTGITARMDVHAASWQTWHLYPQSREIVRTHSTKQLHPDKEPI